MNERNIRWDIYQDPLTVIATNLETGDVARVRREGPIESLRDEALTMLRGKPLKDLLHAHECLLNTLGASNHYWIKSVYRNASAYFKTWKEKYGNVMD